MPTYWPISSACEVCLPAMELVSDVELLKEIQIDRPD
jgi:hypothetical protein